MTVSLVILAVIMAFVVSWLLRQSIGTRPWVATGPREDTTDDKPPVPPARIALWAFLAVVTSLFALFFSAYATRMELADWRPLQEPWLLWANTGLLILGSVSFQRAREAARRGELPGVKTGLLAGGALSFAFLAGQLWAWWLLVGAGDFFAGNPANSFFYLLTGLHALHLLGGLWVWSRTTMRVLQGSEVGQVQLSVQLCTTYWHVLLLIWLVLFGLLLST